MRKYFLKSFAVILLSLLLNGIAFGGIDFDGTDDFITVSDVSNLDFQGSWTISAWIYLHSYGTDGLTLKTIVNKWEDSGNLRGLLFCVGHQAVGNLELSEDNYKKLHIVVSSAGTWANATATALRGNTDVTLNTWHHVATTYDGSTLTLYLDGSSDGTLSWANGVYAHSDPFLIGVHGSVSKVRYFDGIITDVAVWNTNLSATEISLLANSKLKLMVLQIRPASLGGGYWSMDDQSGETSADGDMVRDLSGQNNNGTGNDGANNTGLQWVGESVLSYGSPVLNWQ